MHIPEYFLKNPTNDHKSKPSNRPQIIHNRWRIFSERLVNDTRFELWIIYERKWRRGHRMERDFETLFFVSSREKRAQKSLRRTVFYIWPFWKRHELSLCLTNALKCNRDNEKCNRIIYAALPRIVRKLHRWRSKSRLKWIMPRC